MSVLPPLYVLRHGQTVANRDGIFQGQADSPLTALGQRQAAAMGTALAATLEAGAPITLWVSPIGRVRHSLAMLLPRLGHHPVRLHFDERLKEIDFGRWSLCPQAEIENREPTAWAAWRTDCWNNAPPDGESYADLTARTSAMLADIFVAHGSGGSEAGRVPVILAHGGVGRAIRTALCGYPTASLNTLSVPQDAIIRLVAPDGGGPVLGKAIEQSLGTGVDGSVDGGDGVPLPAASATVRAQIEWAVPEDAPALQSVERDAAQRFAAVGDGEVDPCRSMEIDTLRKAAQDGCIRVIREKANPVAFALEGRVDGQPYLAELSVRWSAGGQGLGLALIADLLARARAIGACRVLLTTFKDVPWNAPWYARMGFLPVPEGQVGPELAALLAEQRSRYTPERRQAMEFWL